MEADNVVPPSAVGRYRIPAITRWVALLVAPTLILTAANSPDPLLIALAAANALIAIAQWALPATVITSTEVRRPLLRRSYQLSDVQRCEPGTGWRSGAVYLTMSDGDRVGLQGVPLTAVPDLRRLVAAARVSAAGPRFSA